MPLAPARFKLRDENVLNRLLCTVARVEGEPIVANNYGSFDTFNQLRIGAANVGTVLSFVSKVTDYEWLEIAIEGNAAAIVVNSATAVETFTLGAVDTPCGNYVVRIPLQGGVESLIFRQTNYVVKSITAYYASDYSQDARDLNQFTLSSYTGWTDSGTSFARYLAIGATLEFGFAGTMYLEYFAKLAITVESQSGAPLPPDSWIYFDGAVSHTLYTWADFLAALESTAKIAAATVSITNNAAEPILITVTPTVANFLGLSTTYGAKWDQVVTEIGPVPPPPEGPTLFPFFDNFNNTTGGGPSGRVRVSQGVSNTGVAWIDGGEGTSQISLQGSDGRLGEARFNASEDSGLATPELDADIPGYYIQAVIHSASTNFAGDPVGTVSLGVKVSLNEARTAIEDGYVLVVTPQDGSAVLMTLTVYAYVAGVPTVLYSGFFTENIGEVSVVRLAVSPTNGALPNHIAVFVNNVNDFSLTNSAVTQDGTFYFKIENTTRTIDTDNYIRVSTVSADVYEYNPV